MFGVMFGVRSCNITFSGLGWWHGKTIKAGISRCRGKRGRP
jgi:hypothetical protein